MLGLNYAEHPWVTSNIKAREAVAKHDIVTSKNQYSRSNVLLKNESKYERVELLLTELRVMRFDCLAGKKISVEQLAEFILRLGDYYDPLQVKLFDDLYNLCFNLYRSGQYKSCWWLMQRVLKMYLNGHETQQFKSLKTMRISLQNLAMLAVNILDSEIWSQFLSNQDRRKYLLEEKLSDAEKLGCGLASLKRAIEAYKSGNFSLSTNNIKASLERLQNDIDYLLEYMGRNQHRIPGDHELFIYLRSMIYGIQELKDLLEMIKDKVNLNNYFEELHNKSIEEYLSDLTNYANQKITGLQKFVSDDFINNYSTSDKKSVNLCNAKMKMLLRGLRLHNIDNGLWLEFDASKDFEKTYGYLKNLATNRYIDPISRYEMRSCFSRIKFKYPNLSADYNILTLKE